MASRIGTILREINRDNINVLTYPCHERYQSNLTKVNALFYMWQGEGIKDWKTVYAPIPPNHILLDPNLGNKQIPLDIDIDVVLSQNKFAHYNISRQLADHFKVPLICLEHCTVMENWTPQQIQQLKGMQGDVNLFISEYSRKAWGWEDGENYRVLHHGVNTEIFSPSLGQQIEGINNKGGYCLAVVNDWINRGQILGYDIFQRVTNGLSTKVLGDTPGLSKPAESISDLVAHYRGANCLINTSIRSPIPSVVLEAMACGTPVVSLNNCMLPEIIENGVNGYITNDENELRKYVKMLLGDVALSKELGKNARQTILEKFSLDKFVENWNSVLKEAISL